MGIIYIEILVSRRLKEEDASQKSTDPRTLSSIKVALEHSLPLHCFGFKYLQTTDRHHGQNANYRLYISILCLLPLYNAYRQSAFSNVY